MLVLAVGGILWAASSVAMALILAVSTLADWRRRRAEIRRGLAQADEFLAGAWAAWEDRQGL